MKKKLSTFLAQKIPVSSGLYLHIELSPLLIQDWSADPECGVQGLSCLTCAHLPPACLSSVWFLHALSVLWIHIHRCVSFTSWAFPLGNPSGRVSCPFLSYLFPYQLCEHFFYDSSYLALCGWKLLMTSLWCSRHISFKVPSTSVSFFVYALVPSYSLWTPCTSWSHLCHHTTHQSPWPLELLKAEWVP